MPFFGYSENLFEEVQSCLWAMVSVSMGWLVRGITPSADKLVVKKCVVVDCVT